MSSVDVNLFELRFELGGNGVHFRCRFPFHEATPTAPQIFPEATAKARPLRRKVLYERFLIVAVQGVELLRRWRVLPEELATVGERVWRQWLRRLYGRLLHRGDRRRRRRVASRLQHHLGGVHTVAVLLALPQLAANKADSDHSTVASHHLSLRASGCEIKDSYFAAVGTPKLFRVQKFVWITN